MDWECRDIVIYDDDGVALYRGPRFLRCTRQIECGAIMTHARLSNLGQCVCGNRRFHPALKVLDVEQLDILAGVIPTLEWEMQMITGELPMIPCVQPERPAESPYVPPTDEELERRELNDQIDDLEYELEAARSKLREIEENK